MNRFERRALDDHIMGTHQSYYDEVLHKCLKCGKTQQVRMFFDMGAWFYVNVNGGFCCDAEMQIVEEKQGRER